MNKNYPSVNFFSNLLIDSTTRVERTCNGQILQAGIFLFDRPSIRLIQRSSFFYFGRSHPNRSFPFHPDCIGIKKTGLNNRNIFNQLFTRVRLFHLFRLFSVAPKNRSFYRFSFVCLLSSQTQWTKNLVFGRFALFLVLFFHPIVSPRRPLCCPPPPPPQTLFILFLGCSFGGSTSKSKINLSCSRKEVSGSEVVEGRRRAKHESSSFLLENNK